MDQNGKNFAYAIALTGGIATGKSTVSHLLEQEGFSVIDADKIAHAVLDRKGEEIAQRFGVEYVTASGVDRKRLGALIFADADQRLALEAIVHPAIREEIFAQARKLEENQKPYMVDIPLYFEKRGYDFPLVALVYAPREMQMERLQRRNGLLAQEAQMRLDAQIDIEEKRKWSNFVIDNSGSLEELEKKVNQFKRELYAHFKI